jgi:hypothetical protein
MADEITRRKSRRGRQVIRHVCVVFYSRVANNTRKGDLAQPLVVRGTRGKWSVDKGDNNATISSQIASIESKIFF